MKQWVTSITPLGPTLPSVGFRAKAKVEHVCIRREPTWSGVATAQTLVRTATQPHPTGLVLAEDPYAQAINEVWRTLRCRIQEVCSPC